MLPTVAPLRHADQHQERRIIGLRAYPWPTVCFDALPSIKLSAGEDFSDRLRILARAVRRDSRERAGPSSITLADFGELVERGLAVRGPSL
jgi:hypothetical protein